MKIKNSLQLIIFVNLVLLLVLYSCQNTKSTPFYNNIFSISETDEIAQLIEHVDSICISKTGEAKIDNAYKKHFGEVRDSSLQSGKFILSDICSAKDILSKNNYDNFFHHSNAELIKTNYANNNNRDTIGYETFNENYDGKYITYLNSLDEENQFVNPFIGKYLKYLNQMKTLITPSSTPLLLSKVDELDFSSQDVRLIYIIHFIIFECKTIALEERDKLGRDK